MKNGKLKLSVAIAILAISAIVYVSSRPGHECKMTDAIGFVNIGPGEPVKIAIMQTLSDGQSPGRTEQAMPIFSRRGSRSTSEYRSL